MKEHIEEIAYDYASSIYGGCTINEDDRNDSIADFKSGVNYVLAHPEEFGLQEKQL